MIKSKAIQAALDAGLASELRRISDDYDSDVAIIFDQEEGKVRVVPGSDYGSAFEVDIHAEVWKQQRKLRRKDLFDEAWDRMLEMPVEVYGYDGDG